MATTFTPAPEVQAVANELIDLYHGHLRQVRMEYVFCSKTPERGGKEVWGTCRKITNLNAFLAGQEDDGGGGNDPFFAITISQPVWEVLETHQRQALVDHELAHAYCEDTEDGFKLTVLPHDMEEFLQVYVRHGNWRPDVDAFERMVKARLGQQELAFEEDPEIVAEREVQRAVSAVRQSPHGQPHTLGLGG